MVQHQKSLVLKTGYCAILLGISGLLTYIIVQVPQLRTLYQVYNLNNDYLDSVAY